MKKPPDELRVEVDEFETVTSRLFIQLFVVPRRCDECEVAVVAWPGSDAAGRRALHGQADEMRGKGGTEAR